MTGPSGRFVHKRATRVIERAIARAIGVLAAGKIVPVKTLRNRSAICNVVGVRKLNVNCYCGIHVFFATS